MDESEFLRRVRASDLPVRGFRTRGDDVFYARADWGCIPEMEHEKSLSLFGTVLFNKADTPDSADSPFGPEDIQEVELPGIASVDYNGVFRVLFPDTVGVLAEHGVEVYSCLGRVTKSALRAKSSHDYSFDECVSTETVDDICNWLPGDGRGMLAITQWAYQRCENVGVRASKMREWLRGVADNKDVSACGVALMGTLPLDCVVAPVSVGAVGFRATRNVSLLDVRAATFTLMCAKDNIPVMCPDTHSLYVCTPRNKVRLVRGGESVGLHISGWDGWDGQSDYRGLGVSGMHRCFCDYIGQAPLRFDASNIANSFVQCTADVELTQRQDSLAHSFVGFSGTLSWRGAHRVYASFRDCDFHSPLDLTEVERVSASVARVNGGVLLPDCFEQLSYDVFQDAGVDSVCTRSVSSVDSPELDVRLVCAEDVTVHSCRVRRLIVDCAAVEHVSFDGNTTLPENSLLAVQQFNEKAFTDLPHNVLDLRKFPSVTELPEGFAKGCAFSAVVVGDNVKTIHAGAFVGCDRLCFIYIPGTANVSSGFIKRRSVARTIYTQKDSVVDTFARKYAINVKYVDNADEFLRVYCEVPDEMAGAAAVAVFLGHSDGAVGAVEEACRYIDAPSDLLSRYPIRESCSVHIRDIELMLIKPVVERAGTCEIAPRLHVLLSYLSEQAPYNASLAALPPSSCGGGQILEVFTGEYGLVGVQLRMRERRCVAWYITRGDTVIHMFSERCKLDICGGISDLVLDYKYGADTKTGRATGIDAVIEHLTFNKGGISILGAELTRRQAEAVWRAIRSTHALLGIYSTKLKTGSVTGFACVSTVTGKTRLLKLRSRTRTGRGFSWVWLQNETCGVISVDDLSAWTRCYSELGGDSAAIEIVRGVSTEKTKNLDTSMPDEQIAAIELICGAMDAWERRERSAYSSDSAIAALNNCGLARRLTTGAWIGMLARGRGVDARCVAECADGARCYVASRGGAPFIVIRENVSNTDENVSFYTAESGDTVLRLVVGTNSLCGCLQDLRRLYANLAGKPQNPENHRAHWVLGESPPDAQDFLRVRAFSEATTVHANISCTPCVVVSKVSGKACFALSTNRLIRAGIRDIQIGGRRVLPVFWARTLADAFRVCELCGFTPFNAKYEVSPHGIIFTQGICQAPDGTVDFTMCNKPQRAVREAVMRGEADGFMCVDGIQELFDLCVKQPPQTLSAP
jgi:hypothetical protein